MIWHKIVDVRYQLDYLSLHIRLQKVIKIHVPIAMILLALVSAILGLLKLSWSSIPPVIFCFVTFVYELIKIISSDLIVSAETLKSADEICVFYDNHFNALCKLWKEYESSAISEDDARTSYYNLADVENTKSIEVNKITFIFNDKRIKKKADTLTRDYLKTYLS